MKMNVTQTDLAHRLGKPQSYVSKLELVERRIDVAEFFEIAHALGIEPKLFLESYAAMINLK